MNELYLAARVQQRAQVLHDARWMQTQIERRIYSVSPAPFGMLLNDRELKIGLEPWQGRLYSIYVRGI